MTDTCPLPTELQGLDFFIPATDLLEVPIFKSATDLTGEGVHWLAVHDLKGQSVRDYLVGLHGEGARIKMDCTTFAQLVMQRNNTAGMLVFGTGDNAGYGFCQLKADVDVCCLMLSDRVTSDHAQAFISGAQWLVGPDCDGLFLGLARQGPRRMSLDDWKRSISQSLVAEVHETGTSRVTTENIHTDKIHSEALCGLFRSLDGQGKLGSEHWDLYVAHRASSHPHTKRPLYASQDCESETRDENSAPSTILHAGRLAMLELDATLGVQSKSEC